MGNPDETLSVYDGGARDGAHLEVEGSGTVCTEMDGSKAPDLAPPPYFCKEVPCFQIDRGCLAL